MTIFLSTSNEDIWPKKCFWVPLVLVSKTACAICTIKESSQVPITYRLDGLDIDFACLLIAYQYCRLCNAMVIQLNEYSPSLK